MIREELSGKIIDGDSIRTYKGLKIFKVENGNEIYWFAAPSCITSSDVDYFMDELTFDFDFDFVEPLNSDLITEVSEADAKNIKCDPAPVKDVQGLEFDNVLDGANKIFHLGIFAVQF